MAQPPPVDLVEDFTEALARLQARVDALELLALAYARFFMDDESVTQLANILSETGSRMMDESDETTVRRALICDDLSGKLMRRFSRDEKGA